MRLILIAGLTFISLLGCTSSKSKKKEEWFIPVPREKLMAMLRDARASCADQTQCHPSAALVVYAAFGPEPGVGQCSGSLVTPDTILTNSHCIPDDLKSQGQDCQGRLVAIFPASRGRPEERVKCSKVLFASDIASEGSDDFALRSDYALIQLEREANRPALPLSREGLSDNLTLSVLAFDPQSDLRLDGLMRLKRCRSVQNTVLVPEFSDPFHVVGTFSDCEIIHGNSGSAAIDSSGRIRAIAHAVLDGHELARRLGRGPVNASSFRPMSLMTNAACLELPNRWEPRQPRCDSPRTGTRVQMPYPGSLDVYYRPTDGDAAERSTVRSVSRF